MEQTPLKSMNQNNNIVPFGKSGLADAVKLKSISTRPFAGITLYFRMQRMCWYCHECLDSESLSTA